VLAVAALGWATVQTVVVLAHAESDVARTFDGPVDRVDVSVDAGSVRLVATDAERITVRARVSDGLVATDHDERLEDGALVLQVSCPPVLSAFCSVDYVVELPADVAVRVRTETAPVTVIGTTAPLDVATDTGGIRLVDTEGDVVARTDTGTVTLDEVVASRTDVRTDTGTVRAGYAREPDAVDVRTDTGSVEIVLPDSGTSYRLVTDTGSGSIAAPVRTDPDAERSIEVSTGTGSITVTYAAR
jgi:hypothetical protein